MTVTSKQLLDRVSRSFALTIPMLEENKRVEVENQYLLARFLDSIEDSRHNIGNKKFLMETFLESLKDCYLVGLDDYLESVANKVDCEKDLFLIENFEIIFDTYYSFDEDTKTLSRHWLNKMAKGMLEYQTKRVDTFQDLDDYCYYVAGTVGRYLNDLIKLKDGIVLDNENAKSFGRFLQKVNIIKDFREDLMEGRIFWPRELYPGENAFEMLENPTNALTVLSRMVENAQMEQHETFEYILSIPKAYLPGYKKFCEVAAVMGAETLRVMKNDFNILYSENPVKIENDKKLEILAKIQTGYGRSDLDKYRIH